MVIYDDPYAYFKAAPFKDVQLFTAIEHASYDTNSMLNLGFLYIQVRCCCRCVGFWIVV